MDCTTEINMIIHDNYWDFAHQPRRKPGRPKKNKDVVVNVPEPIVKPETSVKPKQPKKREKRRVKVKKQVSETKPLVKPKQPPRKQQNNTKKQTPLVKQKQPRKNKNEAINVSEQIVKKQTTNVQPKKRKQRNRPTQYRGAKYIYKTRAEHYKIIKQINCKQLYFGTYQTLTEAQKRVEFLKQHQWDTQYITKKNNKTFIYPHTLKNGDTHYYIKKWVDGKFHSFGAYHTLKEAQERVKFLEQHNWSIEYKYDAHSIKQRHPTRRGLTWE